MTKRGYEILEQIIEYFDIGPDEAYVRSEKDDTGEETLYPIGDVLASLITEAEEYLFATDTPSEDESPDDPDEE